jgi:hypothetical protein
VPEAIRGLIPDLLEHEAEAKELAKADADTAVAAGEPATDEAASEDHAPEEVAGAGH